MRVQIGLGVEAAMQTFERLFALREIQKNPHLLCSHELIPSFSGEQIAAAACAVVTHSAFKQRPAIAARWFIAGQTGLEFDTVARYHRWYLKTGRHPATRQKGTVKWFNRAKRYGFIQRSTGEDVFVHFSAIQQNRYRPLNEGETVEFDLLRAPSGHQYAANVVRAERPRHSERRADKSL
jgi:CspA family cold shock protein